MIVPAITFSLPHNWSEKIRRQARLNSPRRISSWRFFGELGGKRDLEPAKCLHQARISSLFRIRESRLHIAFKIER
jgi:hypothetical protein